MASTYITREGRRFSPEMWACVSEWRRLARAEGIRFVITQGGFNRGGVTASAGTHDGDAVDLSVSGMSEGHVARLVELGRMVGLAAWFRTTKTAKWDTRAQGFGSYHIHAVPNGWGHPSAGARSQAVSYRQGRDGLARNLADLGPGHVSAFRAHTWADYRRTQAAKPGLPGSGVNNPTGGLSMSDIVTLTAKLDYLSEQVKAVQQSAHDDRTYMKSQLRAVADLVGGRAAIDQRNRDTRAAVEAAVASLGLGGSVDAAQLTDEIAAGLAAKLGG